MNRKENPRVSIVIPVYNEAERLAACLEAIATQTVAPYEVIVVDNNSTDGGARLAATYPWVRLLSEPRQGVVYARDRGFNAARGEIIGRIDADSLIAPAWVESIQQLFSDESDLTAATGRMCYYGLVGHQVIERVDLALRRRLARLLDREMVLQGANMALRRSAWRTIRPQLCHQPRQHEDFDLAVHLSQAGFKVGFRESLVAAIGCRQVNSSWREFGHYFMTCPRTYRQHGLGSRRHMYPIISLVIASYLPLKLLSRSYDTESGKFSWLNLLFAAPTVRVNPATFVD